MSFSWTLLIVKFGPINFSAAKYFSEQFNKKKYNKQLYKAIETGKILLIMYIKNTIMYFFKDL